MLLPRGTTDPLTRPITAQCALLGTRAASGPRCRHYVGRDMRWSLAALAVMNGDVNGFMRQPRVSYRVLYALLFTLLVVMVVLLLPGGLNQGGLSVMASGGGGSGGTLVGEEDLLWYAYNATYPPTTPRGEPLIRRLYMHGLPYKFSARIYINIRAPPSLNYRYVPQLSVPDGQASRQQGINTTNDCFVVRL